MRPSLIDPDHLPDTIPEAFQAVARLQPDRVLLQARQAEGYLTLTYAELSAQVEALARGLTEHGLQPQERAAIIVENRPEWIVAYLGIVSAGATAVPLDVQMPPDDLAALLEKSGSRLVFATAQTRKMITPLPSSSRLVLIDGPCEKEDLRWEDLLIRGRSAGRREVPVKPDAVASLLYTSGTTKQPKGVLLTHRNLMANAKAMMRTGLAGHEDTFLLILPLHHAYPFMISLLVPLLLGARITLLTTLKGPDLLQSIQDTGVTMLVGVPQVFAMIRRTILDQVNRRPAPVRAIVKSLLSLSGFVRKKTGWNLGRTIFAQLHRKFGTSLRILCSGGAKLDPQVDKDLTSLGFTIREGYGLTETAPVVAFSPLLHPKAGSVGPPISGVEVRIVTPDETGIGEVAVHGPTVMKGYDLAPEETAEAIRDGWFHTGDLGYLDRDGYLYLTGRIKELIVTPGGKNILPEELERDYLKSPAIAELCIIGVRRQGEEGEYLHAVVVPNLDYVKAQKIHDVQMLIKDELKKAAVNLPSYERITGVTLVKDPLPRTRLGKIRRHLVAATVRSGEAPRKPKQVLSPKDKELLETRVAREVLATLTAMVPDYGEVTLEDHLDLDLGLDSLKVIELLSALEQRFGPLPESLAGEVMTVRDLVEKLRILERKEEIAEAGPSSWKEILEVPPPTKLTEALQAKPGAFDRAATRIGYALMGTTFRTAFKLRITGLEHLPRHGPLMLAVNHLSFLDPFVVLVSVPASVRANLYSLGWEAHFRSRFPAYIARVGHVIPVGPDLPMVTALRTSASVLRQGKSLLIFPEGERSINGELLPFKKGIGILACELGIPVIPGRIEGSYEAWPPEARWPRFRPITMRFGMPISVNAPRMTEWEREGKDPYQAAADLIRDAVAGLE